MYINYSVFQLLCYFWNLCNLLQEAPYAMLREETKGHIYTGNERYEGFCLDLLAELARIVGFEYTIVPVPDGRYGNSNKDGQWDGIVRQLIDRVGILILYCYLLRVRSHINQE